MDVDTEVSKEGDAELMFEPEAPVELGSAH